MSERRELTYKGRTWSQMVDLIGVHAAENLISFEPDLGHAPVAADLSAEDVEALLLAQACLIVHKDCRNPFNDELPRTPGETIDRALSVLDRIIGGGR